MLNRQAHYFCFDLINQVYFQVTPSLVRCLVEDRFQSTINGSVLLALASGRVVCVQEEKLL